MTFFEAVAKNYNIADREFKAKLTGAEVLSLVAMVQIVKSLYPGRSFTEHFAEAIGIIKGLIEVVAEVDPAAAAQLRAGWELGTL